MAHTFTTSLAAALMIALMPAASALARKPAPHRPLLHGVAYKAPAHKAAVPVVHKAPARAEAAGDGDRFRYDSCGCSGS